jgi:chaperonin cofactor prefoldin
VRYIEQDRDTLDLRIRELTNQRKRLRTSYNELQRNLDDNLRSSEAMMDLKKFLMN